MTAVKTTIGARDEARDILVQRISGLTALQAQEALAEIVAMLLANGDGDVVGPASATDNALARFDGTTGKLLQDSLVTLGDTGIMNGATAIGVNATADTTNRLSVNSAAVLFNHAGAGTQIKVNKNASGDTASYLFQTGFSGRAEFGTIGDDDFTLKTSPDGSAFTTALIADNSTGAIRVAVNLRPSANDGAALGTTSARWSDLFGATGFVINFNSDWIATHSAGILTVGTGDLRVTTAGTNSASVVTVGGTQTLTAKTLTSPTITTSPTAAGATWTDLGTVTTVDVNGGTIDGAVIGGASAAAITGTLITGNRFVPNSATVPTNGLYLPAANTLGWAVNSAAEMQLTSTALSPAVSDGNALGTTALMWSDAFFASGAVLNYNNGNVLLTHASGELRLSGPAQTVLAISPVGNAGIELGRIDGNSSTPFLDFHSGATATDYDARLLASGGTGSDGGGLLTITAGAGVTIGTSAPFTAGTIELGNASDTTISRSAAGVIAVEGVPLYSNIPQNSQSAAYTTVLADAQKHILHPSSDNNARTFTIAANASVAYPVGTAITFVNQINTVTIAINSDTLTLAGAGTTGSRTLAANGIATALKVGTTSWLISGTGLT